VIQPDAMADDLGWKPEPFIRRACSGHDRRSGPTSPSRQTDSALVRAWRSAGLFGEDPIDSRAANAECRSDGAGRFTLSVHPLRESGFRLIEHLNSADLLSARPTWRACRRGRSPRGQVRGCCPHCVGRRAARSRSRRVPMA
jgi:hypothetical protein